MFHKNVQQYGDNIIFEFKYLDKKWFIQMLLAEIYARNKV